MGKGVNKVIIVGNLGQDPEVKYMPSGDCIANISIATSESWKDKQTGQQQERTEWHQACFFGRLAEIARDYLKKGAKVYIEGSLRTRKWKDKQTGQDRYSTDIVVKEMQMLDSRGDNPQPGQQPGQQPSQPQQQSQQQSQQQPQQNQGYQPAGPDVGDAFDDDIPF